MNQRDQGMINILSATLKLFKENGYKNTNMRQIADKAGVSLGMINHYFGSKNTLGAYSIALLAEHVSMRLDEIINFDTCPITYDLALTRAVNIFMLNGCFRKFYIDSLHEDLFFDYVTATPMRLITALKKKYQFTTNNDTILLYSKYIPYSIEKTLVLKKEEGKFTSIPYEDIPWHICVASMGNFIAIEEIEKNKDYAIQISDQIMKTIPPFPSKAQIKQFIQNKNKDLLSV